MDEQRQWHRLFGMSWTDFFTGLPVVVELEKDLSLKQQLLDVVVIRTSNEPLACQLPDGFENLAAHNLVSFKSHREPLDAWTLSELVGHYVNYRKQVSPKVDDLLPVSDFRLFAVCVRFPQGLQDAGLLEAVQPGVYQVRYFADVIRVVVVHQLPQQDQNALLHLFSARARQVQYGARIYRPRSAQTSTFLFQLFDRYREEGMPMPFTVEEFERQGLEKMARDPRVVGWLLKDPEVIKQIRKDPEVIEQIRKDPEVIERVLEGVPAEKRLEGVSVEQLLVSLSPQMREQLRQRLQAGDDTPTPP